MFYLDLFAALQEHGVDYVLVGGLALNIHGVERATMDVDLMLALDAGNLGRFVKAAAALGLKPVLPLPIGELLQPDKRREWVEQRRMAAFALHADRRGTPTVDVLIAPSIPFPEVFARRVVKQVGGTAVSLASVDDMIRLKESTGRQRDAAAESSGARMSRPPTEPVDFSYEISDERLLAYSALPVIDRLRWLDEILQFTLAVRAAPECEKEPRTRIDRA